MLLCQVVGIGSQNGHFALAAHDGLRERHLQQRTGKHHLGYRGGQALLIIGVEAAAGGNGLHTLGCQFLAYADILVQQLLTGVCLHRFHVGALDVHQLHSKGIGCGIGAVARQSFQLHQGVTYLAGFPAQQRDFRLLLHNTRLLYKL